MSVKTILVAHRSAAVRNRFASALADARHAFVLAGEEAAAHAALADTAAPVSLALIDLGLAEEGVGFVRALRQRGPRAVPIVVFAGSVASASEVAALASMNVAGYMNEHAGAQQILPALAPHLFPDNFNRRAGARIKVRIPVSFRAGTILTGATTLEVGRGGLAIRTMDPLATGTALQVTFRLPGAPDEIDAFGRVAWSDRKVGMGVQFESLAAEHQQALDAFVNNVGVTNPG